MYQITSSGTDSHSAEVGIITCMSCRYFEEHFTQKGRAKVGKPCGRSRT